MSQRSGPRNPSDDPAQRVETSAEDFVLNHTFEIEDGLRKSVTLARKGRNVTVEITCIDGAVTDTTAESFEVDGSVRISLTEGGVYLSGYRALLADRVRLRRTRFF